MSNKLKNIISNLIGLGVIALGTVKYLENDNLINFVSLLVIGLACFLFKVSETKSWIKKIFGKKLGKTTTTYNMVSREDNEEEQPPVDDVIGDSPDPNKEEK